MQTARIAWVASWASLLLPGVQRCLEVPCFPLTNAAEATDADVQSYSDGSSGASEQLLSFSEFLSQQEDQSFGTAALLSSDFLAFQPEKTAFWDDQLRSPIVDLTSISIRPTQTDLTLKGSMPEARGEPFSAHNSLPSLNRPVPLDNLGQCLTQEQTVRIPQTHALQGMFPVWMQGCLVAAFPTQEPAKRLNQQLDYLRNQPDVNWAQLHPVLIGTTPAAKLGDRVLFTITAETAAALNYHPHELAILWVNLIRLAAGQKPLAVGEAQAQMYQLQETDQLLKGVASWYGPYFHGRFTANGEIYNQYDLTAAHRTLPLGTFVKVSNLQNHKSVIVRINDRGPYYDEHERILDLSYQAAQMLDGQTSGLMPITAVVMAPEASMTMPLLSPEWPSSQPQKIASVP
jgi:rare lipoprotein A (peptidoglycan hydrolase)